MKRIKKSISEIDERIKHISTEIELQISQNKSVLYPEIRKHFRHIFKDIVNLPSYIYIKINGAGNVDFDEVIQNNDDSDITAANKGTTYKKFLCKI